MNRLLASVPGRLRGSVRAAAIGLAALSALSLSVAQVASAAQGVAIDLGNLTVEEPLSGGDRLVLPRFHVTNPGSEAAGYRMGIGGIVEDGALEPSDTWFTFEPRTFTLQPGQSQTVVARMELPDDVVVGSYVGLVRAQLIAEGTGSLVGGAAATYLRFDLVAGPVEQSTEGVLAAPPALDRLTGQWWAPVLALLLVVVAVAALRRYRFSMVRR